MTVPANGYEPSPLRLVVTLAFAGLFSGLAIVGIYDATLPRITANKAAALQSAIFKVLPGVAAFRTLAYEEGTLKEPTGELDLSEPIYAGFDASGELVGYAVPGEGPGFQDTIRLLFGYRPDRGLIVGLEVLESRETPGLGDKIYKDVDFVANFEALTPQPKIVAVKKGSKSAPNEIDAITGATISSVAVANIINAATDRWLPLLGAPVPAVTR